MKWWRRKQPAEQYKYSFWPGDVVRLKSGGPAMVVAVEVSNDAAYWTGAEWGVHCAWFDGNQARRAVFFPPQLEKTPPIDKSSEPAP